MFRVKWYIASGLIAGIMAVSAMGQDAIDAGAYPAGNYQWRIDVDPMTAGYQIARRVTGPANSAFNIDVRMANVPASLPAREIFFTIYYDSTLISYSMLVACTPGAVTCNDMWASGSMGNVKWRTIQIRTDFNCVGVSGDILVATLRFMVVGPRGVAGLDVTNPFNGNPPGSYSGLGTSPCGTLLAPFGNVAKAVVVVDPDGAANLSALTVNDTGNNPSLNANLHNPDSDPTLGIARVTLRSALEVANATPGNNRITFFIPGAATITNPLMPVLSDAAGVHVDGRTQAAPGVEVNGPAAAAMGFDINSNGNIIEALTINNFTGGGNTGVRINGSNNTVKSCRIGTNTAANAPVANDSGIRVTAGTGNQIGGAAAADANVISGNTNAGVSISAGTGVKLLGNKIGTNGAGNGAIANADGVVVTGGNNHEIGGAAAGEGNLISGNAGTGITLSGGTGTLIRGNLIGTNAIGGAALGNMMLGILITGCNNNVVGGTTAGARNIISGTPNPLGSGIEINLGATGNVVQGNYIGTNDVATTALPNGYAGVYVNAAPGNTIGGALAGAGNLISGNGNTGVAGAGWGVLISGAASSVNQVQKNYIGTNALGTVPMRNTQDGIQIEAGAHDNLIGIAGAGNLISGNLLNGVRVIGAFSDSNLIRANYIGTDASGASPLPNGNNGVRIENNAWYNEVGGTTPAMGNYIAANTGDGVRITSGPLGPSSNNRVENNRIGDASLMGNGLDGVSLLSGVANVVTNNTILGNSRSGVEIAGAGTDQNEILDNFIGSISAPNAQNGVSIHTGAQMNQVSRNNIGNNSESGVEILGSGTDGNIVTANGLMGNQESGVIIDAGASGNVVGGTDPIAANDINGNFDYGVAILDGTANFIQGNTIRNNARGGVEVLAGVGNAIRANAVYSNQNGAGLTALGIDLGDDGVTLNDAGDPDGGPNMLQNYPVLTAAIIGGAGVTINGTMSGAASTSYAVEFFSNSNCDPSGYGEGEQYLGSDTVNTDASGAANFSISLSQTVSDGSAITATATDPNNNTSEFSQCVAAMVQPQWPACSTCPGDLNGDGLVNGQDIQPFVICWLDPSSPPASNCGCLDANASQSRDDADLAFFVARLLSSSATCP